MVFSERPFMKGQGWGQSDLGQQSLLEGGLYETDMDLKIPEAIAG